MAKMTEEQRKERARTRAIEEAAQREAAYRRKAAKRRAWIELDAYLTWEEFQSGVRCKICGKEFLDGLGDSRPQNQMTAEEIVEKAAYRAQVRAEHPDCDAVLWSVHGNRTLHCGECCPPPPFSPAKLEAIRRIFSRPRRPEHEMEIWRLELSCGHYTEKSQHMSNADCTFTLDVLDCRECGEPKGVIGSELIREGRKEPSTPTTPPADARSQEEAQAAADVEAARRLLSDANKRLRKIRVDNRSERT
ncbi:hypothetical protein [Prescottella equi]